MILALAGLSKSGKSTLAKELVRSLDWPRLGFGEYVKHVAAKQGIEPTFSALQSLGQSMVENNQESFVKAVFEFGGLSPSDDVILDGLRHHEVVTALETYVYPEPVVVVLVQVAQNVLAERYKHAGLTLSTVLAAPAEQQVQYVLAKYATLIVDGNRPTYQTVREVSDLIKMGR